MDPVTLMMIAAGISSGISAFGATWNTMAANTQLDNQYQQLVNREEALTGVYQTRKAQLGQDLVDQQNKLAAATGDLQANLGQRGIYGPTAAQAATAFAGRNEQLIGQQNQDKNNLLNLSYEGQMDQVKNAMAGVNLKEQSVNDNYWLNMAGIGLGAAAQIIKNQEPTSSIGLGSSSGSGSLQAGPAGAGDAINLSGLLG